MKCLYFFCCLLLTLAANSQKIVRGTVLDQMKNKAVANATIYLSGTSIGTSTDEQGKFSIPIPPGKYNLIVTLPRFETYHQIIDAFNPKDSITIRLKTKAESKETAFDHFEKGSWEKWGSFFIQNFIGTSMNAKDCKIKNPRSIHFYSNDNTGQLVVAADEPLIIQNDALGYTILYKLESFRCDFNSLSLAYTGYPFFQPMKGTTAKQKAWEQNRSDAYFGSLMHFMRSVYINRISEEGFDVRSLRKVRNTYTSHIGETGTTTDSTSLDKTNDYADQILNPDNYKDIIGATLTGDSIAYAIDPHTAALAFNNFLLVVYHGKDAPSEYQEQKGETGMTSQLILTNAKPVEIESNGSYFDPADLMLLGYWAWSEKIANQLPFDYNPPKQDL